MKDSTYLKPSYRQIAIQNTVAHLRNCDRICKKPRPAPVLFSLNKIHKTRKALPEIKFLNMSSSILNTRLRYDLGLQPTRLRIFNENKQIYQRLVTVKHHINNTQPFQYTKKSFNSCLKLNPDWEVQSIRSLPKGLQDNSILTICHKSQTSKPMLRVGEGNLKMLVKFQRSVFRGIKFNSEDLYCIKVKTPNDTIKSWKFNVEELQTLAFKIKLKNTHSVAKFIFYHCRGNLQLKLGKLQLTCAEEFQKNISLSKSGNSVGNIFVKLQIK